MSIYDANAVQFITWDCNTHTHCELQTDSLRLDVNQMGELFKVFYGNVFLK